MNQVEFLLKTKLKASLDGKPIDKDYRAAMCLDLDKPRWTLKILQPIGEHDLLHPTGGGWYLDTLLKREEGGSTDGISIDFGQKWQVDSGMIAVLHEAVVTAAMFSKAEGNVKEGWKKLNKPNKQIA